MIDISIKSLKELGITLYNREGEMKPLPILIEEVKDAYYRINPESKPLLTIELQDETSVPKVFYQGEEITDKIHISFDWDTDTSIPGGLTYAIEHGITGEGYLVTNRIERRVKGHAAD